MDIASSADKESMLPTSAGLRAGMPVTEEIVRRFTEEGPGAPRDRHVEPVLDHEESLHNAILTAMGELRVPSDEDRARPGHELQVPEQPPNTVVGSPEYKKDCPSRNMIQGARTLAATMVILWQDAMQAAGHLIPP